MSGVLWRYTSGDKRLVERKRKEKAGYSVHSAGISTLIVKATEMEEITSESKKWPGSQS